MTSEHPAGSMSSSHASGPEPERAVALHGPVAFDGIGGVTAARSRADLLADHIGERVIAQGLQPGDPVGTLDRLREETGFARATVSEAVRLLRDRGVLEIRPGRGGGLFVAASTPVVRLRRTLLSIQEQPTTVLDAIELREHLESLIDLSAARCRTRRDVSALRRCLARMETAASWQDFMQGNWSLHERIAQICPNEMARAVYIGTLGHLTASTSMVVGDRGVEHEYQQERYKVHHDLVEAIAAADEAAVMDAVARHQVKA